MERNQRYFLCAVVGGLLAGCANLNAIHYTRDLHEQTLVTDASQRAIVNFGYADDKSATKPIRLCAEPSPDVAMALTNATQLALGYQARGGESPGTAAALAGPQKNYGVNFSNASVSSIAQLGERLAVIQLIRDKMYRACEAYSNGAISSVTYTLMLARLDKTMMSLLSSEMAAGAFGRTLAQLGGGSAGAGGADAAALKGQQEEIQKVVDKINALKFEPAADKPTDKSKDVAELGGLMKSLNNELYRLYGMETGVARSVANGAPAGATGSIASTHSGSTEAVVSVHRAFIDDDGTEPLTDACIQALQEFEGGVPISAAAKAEVAALRSAAIESSVCVADAERKMDEFKESIDVKTRMKLLCDAKKDKASSVCAESADLDRVKASLQAKQDERDSCEKKALATIGNSLLPSRGGVFAAMCYERILGGSSFYLNKRMKQKRELRELDNQRIQAERPAQQQGLDICRAVLTDKSASDEEKKAFAKPCADLVGSMSKAAGDTGSTEGKKKAPAKNGPKAPTAGGDAKKKDAAADKPAAEAPGKAGGDGAGKKDDAVKKPEEKK